MFIDYSNPDKVIIKHKDEVCCGHFSKGVSFDYNSSYLFVDGHANSYPFRVLGIDNQYSFVTAIVRYTCENGDFPEVKTKNDLIKVLDALNKEYDKKFGKKFHQFKVGDKVLIKKDLEVGKAYGPLEFLYRMTNLAGSIATITKISDKAFKLKEDRHDFWWSPEMIECAVAESHLGTIKLEEKAEIRDNPKMYYEDLKFGGPAIIDTLSYYKCQTIDHLVDTTVNINDFITKKESYKLNFNN